MKKELSKQALHSRKHYLNHKEEYFLRNKKRKKEIKEFVNSFKDNPCMDCKKKYPTYVMDFDHKGNKDFNLARAGDRRISNERILKEIKKCELVCANCHRIRTYNANSSSGRMRVSDTRHRGSNP